MAIIPQRQLFGWREIEDLGELERLRLVLDHLPDGKLMADLERERGRGRDDYPVRAVWNSLLVGIVYQHPSIESLRRELLRNAQLRQLCGFDILQGARAVPLAWAYTRFLRKLQGRLEQLEEIFRRAVSGLAEVVPDFGKVLAMDGKAIPSHARGKQGKRARKPDGRRDTDANWGVKTYRGRREDGSLCQRTKNWFGYCLHLTVDATYELPVDFMVTKASASEVIVAHRMVDRMAAERPELLARCESLLGDKAYDDVKLLDKLWCEYRIKPVIDIRDCWQDGEETHLVGGWENVVHDYQGRVYCHCPQTGLRRELAYGGFEERRQTLKYRCPALHYGLECRGRDRCRVKSGIRIALKENSRVFTPVARSSYRWRRLYAQRTAVERVNSRLDRCFGLEQHFVRGLRKMRLKCTLALTVMLAMALGRIKEKRGEHLRSLVKAA